MIGYVTLGTKHLLRAAAFYDALLAEIGARRFMESDRLVGWAIAPDKPMLSVCKPWDGTPATDGGVRGAGGRVWQTCRVSTMA